MVNLFNDKAFRLKNGSEGFVRLLVWLLCKATSKVFFKFLYVSLCI